MGKDKKGTRERERERGKRNRGKGRDVLRTCVKDEKGRRGKEWMRVDKDDKMEQGMKTNR